MKKKTFFPSVGKLEAFSVSLAQDARPALDLPQDVAVSLWSGVWSMATYEGMSARSRSGDVTEVFAAAAVKWKIVVSEKQMINGLSSEYSTASWMTCGSAPWNCSAACDAWVLEYPKCFGEKKKEGKGPEKLCKSLHHSSPEKPPEDCGELYCRRDTTSVCDATCWWVQVLQPSGSATTGPWNACLSLERKKCAVKTNKISSKKDIRE